MNQSIIFQMHIFKIVWFRCKAIVKKNPTFLALESFKHINTTKYLNLNPNPRPKTFPSTQTLTLHRFIDLWFRNETLISTEYNVII